MAHFIFGFIIYPYSKVTLCGNIEFTYNLKKSFHKHFIKEINHYHNN